jgi:hypothetical protein
MKIFTAFHSIIKRSEETISSARQWAISFHFMNPWLRLYMYECVKLSCKIIKVLFMIIARAKKEWKVYLNVPLIVIVYIVINFTRQTQHTQYLSLLAQRQFVFLFLYGNQSDTLDRNFLSFWRSFNLHKKLKRFFE